MTPPPDRDNRYAIGPRVADRSGGGVTLFGSARKHLASVKNYKPGKPLEELERQYGVKNAVKMASNENALGPSPKAMSAARKALTRAHRYPDGGCFYLRQKLAQFLKVAPESLIFGNGSDELLVFAVRAFVEPGDEILIADPTFLIYEIAAQVERASVVKVPMKNFRYDLSGMANKLGPKTRVVFIANPDNPVGTYVTAVQLESFMAKVPSDTIVVLDEAYYEFACAHRDYPRSLDLLRRYRNLIVTRTFSKAYGLSGLRVGYAVADPSVVEAMNKVREPFNVNLVAQEAARAALDDHAHLKRTLRLVRDGRAYLERELKKLKLGIVPTATNFILVDLNRDSGPVYEALLRRGVIVRAMDAWGLKHFIRVTIGRGSENRRFIAALKKVI